MSLAEDSTNDAAMLAEQTAALAVEHGWTVAVAESLTSGRIAACLGAAPDASSWFAGGVVAYASGVKFKVLNVDPGPVVSGRCAAQMARGVASLTEADFAVAATGVGGPGAEEGQPAGTVFLAVSSEAGEVVTQHRFDGEPAGVVERATTTAVQHLLSAMVSCRQSNSG